MKSKQVLSIILILSLLTVCSPIFAEENEPLKNDSVFAVSTPEELLDAASAISNPYLTKSYSTIILLNDIDMAGYDWKPINQNSTPDNQYQKVFSGTFDGNGKSIKNLTIGSPDNPNTTDRFVGLFGTFRGTLKNLKLESFNIYANYSNKQEPNKMPHVGGLVGYNQGTILNCTVSGNIQNSAPNSYVGLVTAVNDKNIISCEAEGTIQTTHDTLVGGIASKNINNIHSCSSIVDIFTGENNEAGGICGNNSGYLDSSGINHVGITNCYSICNIEAGSDSIAGIVVGTNKSIASVDSQQWFWNKDSTININHSIVETIPIGNMPNETASPMTTAEMKSQQFLDLLNSRIDLDATVMSENVSTWYFRDNNDFPKHYNIQKAENTWSGFIKKPEKKNNSTYLIRDGSELAWYAFCSNYGLLELDENNIILQNDIDLGGKFWVPFKFNGNFNAQGYQIKNLTIGTNTNYDRTSYIAGLFQYLGPNAVIKNLGVTDVSIYVKTYPQKDPLSTTPVIGGITAINQGGKILNCYVTGSFVIEDTTKEAKAGLLAGVNNYGNVSNCYVSGNVDGADLGGALFGQCLNSDALKNCYWNKDTSITLGIGKPASSLNAKSYAEMCDTSFVETLNQGIQQSEEKNLLYWTILSGQNNGLPILEAKINASPTATPTGQPAIPSPSPEQNHLPYMNGYPDGSFRPEANITRAETAALFSKLYDSPVLGSKELFSDVSETDWFAQAVGDMSSQGLITGYEDGTFRPDIPVTRAEFSVLITKFLKMEPIASENYPFSDISAHWAAPYILASYQNGFISGYENGTFQPDYYITRAEVTAMLNRVLKRIPDPDKLKTVLNGETTLFPDVEPSHWAYYNIIEATYNHTVASFH